MSKSALALASVSLTLSWVCSSSAVASRLGGHAVAAIVGAVEFAEVGIPEQLPPERDPQAVQGVLTQVVQVQPIRFPEAPLI